MSMGIRQWHKIAATKPAMTIPTQKGVCGDAEDLRQPGKHGDIRAGLIIFPLAYRLGSDTQLFRQLILGHAQALSVFRDPSSNGLLHGDPSLCFMPTSCHKSA